MLRFSLRYAGCVAIALLALTHASGVRAAEPSTPSEPDLVLDTPSHMVFNDGAMCSFEIMGNELYVACDAFSESDCRALTTMGKRLLQASTRVNMKPAAGLLSRAHCQPGQRNLVVYDVQMLGEFEATYTAVKPAPKIWE